MDNAASNQAPQYNKQQFKELESPEINISSKKRPKSYKLICKAALKKFGYVVLKSLGNASESVVQLSESLVRNKFGVYEKIESDITDLDDANNEAGTRKGISFIVKLRKSPDFDSLVKEFD